MSSLPRNLANYFWHIQSVTAPSPYTAQIFFCILLCFYLSWNNKTWLPKMLASTSIFNIKIAIQKFTNFKKFFFRFYLFLKRGEGRERETSMCGCLLCTPYLCTLYWGPGPQPRHVPWLGVEPVTLWFIGWRSIHWATPARAFNEFFFNACWYDSCHNTV